MKNIDRKIIQVTKDDIWHIDSRDYDIKYWSGGWYSKVDVNEFLDTIIEFNNKILNKKITREDILLEFVEKAWSIEEIWNEYLYEDEREKFDHNIEVFKEEGVSYIIDIITENIEIKDFEVIAKLFDCTFGTVGYSPWAYYLSWKDVDYSFVRDMYEGWYWYNLELLDEEGFAEDSIGGVYAPDDKELLMAIRENFGISEDEFYLVDNEVTTYFNFDKVQEFESVSYSYQII